MVYASMMASLSFNTKWVGIFLWPCLIVAILIKHRENANSARHSLLTVLFCFVIFSVIFVITNPFLFLNLSTAIQQLREISSAISFGVSGFKSDTNGLGWLDVLVSSNMMGVTVFYLSIASFTLFFSGILHRLLTHRRLETLYWKNIILVICILVLSLYLVLFVRYMAGRYILPIVPFAYLLVGQLIWSILQRIHATNSHIGTFFILIFLLSVSYLSESAIDNSLHYRDEFLRRANSPFIYAGEWISEKYPVNTVFSVDKGCYVPSKYQTVYARFGQTEELILRVNPDVICINAEISGRFKNPELRTGYYLGPEEYDKSYAFYRDLRSGSLGTFKLVKNYSDVEIYEKQKNESGVH
jgi:hypothetical protein